MQRYHHHDTCRCVQTKTGQMCGQLLKLFAGRAFRSLFDKESLRWFDQDTEDNQLAVYVLNSRVLL